MKINVNRKDNVTDAECIYITLGNGSTFQISEHAGAMKVIALDNEDNILVNPCTGNSMLVYNARITETE